MRTIGEVKKQIDGLPAAEAAAIVRGAREKINQRRLDLVEKASDLSRQLAACEGSDKSNPKLAARLRAFRDQTNDERQTVIDTASALSALLLDIEGEPVPAPSIKPIVSIAPVT